MGRWGIQNFESDGAFDILGIWLSRMVEEIESTLDDESDLSPLYDESGEAWVVANVELLCVLSEHYQTWPELEVDDVENWKKRYLAAFNRRIVEQEIEEDYAEKRLKVIEETFERLKEIVRERHSM